VTVGRGRPVRRARRGPPARLTDAAQLAHRTMLWAHRAHVPSARPNITRSTALRQSAQPASANPQATTGRGPTIRATRTVLGRRLARRGQLRDPGRRRAGQRAARRCSVFRSCRLALGESSRGGIVLGRSPRGRVTARAPRAELRRRQRGDSRGGRASALSRREQRHLTNRRWPRTQPMHRRWASATPIPVAGPTVGLTPVTERCRRARSRGQGFSRPRNGPRVTSVPKCDIARPARYARRAGS
jgi:hypothetical protein